MKIKEGKPSIKNPTFDSTKPFATRLWNTFRLWMRQREGKRKKKSDENAEELNDVCVSDWVQAWWIE